MEREKKRGKERGRGKEEGRRGRKEKTLLTVL